MNALDRPGSSRRVWGPERLCFSQALAGEDSQGLEGRGARCDGEPAPGRPPRCGEEDGALPGLLVSAHL